MENLTLDALVSATGVETPNPQLRTYVELHLRRQQAMTHSVFLCPRRLFSMVVLVF